MKPVYMINGFLESGKSEFICFTLAQPYFRIKGKTLLILCEEGEVEYEPELLKQTNTVVELIEEEEDFNPTHLAELEKKHKPERIIVEFNGMWNYKNAKLPWYWKIEQQITTIDGSTFPMYYTNMRSLLAEMVRKSEMIIFNRCDEVRDQLNTYKRNIKAVNASADVIFEDANGEIDEIGAYLDMLDDDLTNVETVIKTGNRMADAILNSKLSLAAQKEIKVKAEANIPVSLTVSELDLCTVIGNLLDNAMDACMELPVEERLIRIYMEMKGNYLYISVINTAGGKKKSNFRTTKGEGHGFGLKRIDMIVEKYGGYITRASEDGAFSTEVLLPQ